MAKIRWLELLEATLRHRMNGQTVKVDSRDERQKLTEFKEDAIVQYVLDLDERGFTPRIDGVEDMANLLLGKRDGGCKRGGARRQRRRWPEMSDNMT